MVVKVRLLAVRRSRSYWKRWPNVRTVERQGKCANRASSARTCRTAFCKDKDMADMMPAR